MRFLSEDFGCLLRKMRQDRSLTQQQAGELARLNRKMVMRIEQGENVGIEEVHKLAFALGFTLSLEEKIRPTWENARQYFLDDDDD